MATIDSYLDELLAAPPSAVRANAIETARDLDADAITDASPGMEAARFDGASGPIAGTHPDSDVLATAAAHRDADTSSAAATPGIVTASSLDVQRHHAIDAPAAREPAPVTSRATAVPDLSAFLPPAASSIAPVARTAVAIAQASAVRTATGGHRWLRVCIGRDSYAFELLRVQEVVRVAPVVAMRGAAHAVLGVMNLRGRIVPVFDLGLWLDVGPVHAEDRARVVVIERDDELIGVLVTAVDDVVSLEREHVEPPLPGADPGATLGVARIGAGVPTVLLDADALFD